MKVTNKIKIHLDDPRLVPPVDVMQCDAYTRVLEMSLYSGGAEWPVPDGASVAVAYHGASGKGIYDTLPDGTAACTVASNVVTAVVAPQALAMSGETKLTVVFTDDTGKQLATFCVTLEVAANPAVGAMKPSNYINLRQWMSAELATLLDEMGVKPFRVHVFPAVEGYATEETMGDIQAAAEDGRTVHCDLKTEDQELLTLPMVKVEGGVCYFAAVCDGVEWLVTITRDTEDNAVVTVIQREVGATAFWVNVTNAVDEDGVYIGGVTADKKYAEILAAHEAGQAVYCQLPDGSVLVLAAIDDTGAVFQGVANREYQRVVIKADDTITYNSGKYALLEELPAAGADGKSAYEYAQDGGYTGTEEEFTAKLAEEVPTKVSQLENDSGYLSSAPVSSVNGKTGAVQIDIPTVPTALPNPRALTINGQTYNGSKDVSVQTPGGISVKAYGAKGDGVTDDTAAFQTAMAANRTVFVPGGTYVLSDTLVIRENCCLELSQDTILQFTQTEGNCLDLRGSATLRGNHGIISVPYTFSGNVIAIDTALETGDLIIPPYLKAGSHMFKRQRFVYDVNIIKPDASGFCRSDDGACNGTAIYMSADRQSSMSWMWALSLNGIRIAGGFSYGIRAVNYDSPSDAEGHYEDDAWNHDMRVEAVIEACEVGVALENCNGAHLAVTVQPCSAMDGTAYAKWGFYLNDAKFIDMIGSRVWDWVESNTLWTLGGQYQHIALIGQCRGLILDDFMYYESGTDIRELIYTDLASNLEKMTIMQEPVTRWFKPKDGAPYFFDGTVEKRLMHAEDMGEYFVTDRIEDYTDALAVAIDTDGAIYNGIGYAKHGGALNSSGAIVADTEAWYGHTGFIACKPGDVIYIKNIILSESDGYTKAFTYDSNFNLLGQNNIVAIIDGTTTGEFTGTATDDGGTLTVVRQNTAYMRIGFKSVFMGDAPIIAVNEEIKFTQAGFLADGIKVKAENVVGGGGGAQPDWNAAEGEVGHIENRTHYRELVEVLNETPTYTDEEVFEFGADWSPTVGETYYVNYNGTEYTCVAGSLEGVPYLGNLALAAYGNDTGEPFLMFYEGGLSSIDANGATEITVKISGYQYIALPREYLPKMCHVVTVLEDQLTSSGSGLARISCDTTELVEALRNNLPVYLDLSAIAGCEKRLLVSTWQVPGGSLDRYADAADAVQVQLFACELQLGGSANKTWSVFINFTD